MHSFILYLFRGAITHMYMQFGWKEDRIQPKLPFKIWSIYAIHSPYFWSFHLHTLNTCSCIIIPVLCAYTNKIALMFQTPKRGSCIRVRKSAALLHYIQHALYALLSQRWGRISVQFEIIYNRWKKSYVCKFDFQIFRWGK